MRIAIMEVCRSPEVQKWDTEGQVLHAGLPALGLTPVLFSNDHSWRAVPGVRAWAGPAILFRLAHQQRIDVLHLAMHGTADGLVLGWKGPLGQRVPRTVLTPALVRERLRLNGCAQDLPRTAQLPVLRCLKHPSEPLERSAA